MTPKLDTVGFASHGANKPPSTNDTTIPSIETRWNRVIAMGRLRILIPPWMPRRLFVSFAAFFLAEWAAAGRTRGHDPPRY